MFVLCSALPCAPDSRKFPARPPGMFAPNRRQVSLGLGDPAPTRRNPYGPSAAADALSIALGTSPLLSGSVLAQRGEARGDDGKFQQRSCPVQPTTTQCLPEAPTTGGSGKARKTHRRPKHVGAKFTAEPSLRLRLFELDGVSIGRVFLLRKIQRLGFNAEETIRAHFGRYAGIDGVLSTHSKIMTTCGRFVRRVRPSNFAIIIMASEAAVTAIHSLGRHQIVGGLSVRVERFEYRPFPQYDDVKESQHVVEGGDESGDESCDKLRDAATRKKESSTSIAPKVAAPKAAGLVATGDSCYNVSTCDSLNALSGESDDGCRVHSDFQYFSTDDGF